MHTASQALAIERQASAQPSLAERVSRPKTRAILGLMRLNFLSVAIIENVIDEVNEIGRFENPVVTTVALEKEFYDAEEYHQNYLKKNPSGYSCHFERD